VSKALIELMLQPHKIGLIFSREGQLGFALDNSWKAVDIGAGGWLVGIDVAPDGTMVVRTDTYGAFLWNGTSWTQLATASSMPANVFYSAAVYELRIAPSNSNIMYMEMSDGLYKTVDKGGTWTKTTFPIMNLTTSQDSRMDGQKMAVDPTDPNTVFAGTQKDGLWVTRDGGGSWQKITAVPSGTNTNDPNLTGIAIKGSTVFVGTAGSGVYMSADKGITWKAIGGPADVSHAVVSADGSYYASDNSVGALWKYSGGTWQKVIDNGVHAVAVDPFNSSHIVVTNGGGDIRESHTGGVTWGEWNQNKQLESSNDVPWLENSGRYLSSGGLVFDPLVQGKLWQSAGVGVWSTEIPKDMNWATVVTWNSHSQGIEQLVANEVIAPAGGNPIFASWDRPFIEMGDLDSYATGYSGGHFSMGWSVDYASSNPSFIVGISDWWGTEESGFSTDGGKTWQKFSGLPTWAKDTVGGSIAASTPLNFIWAATGNQPPAYTLDGGKTWTNINIPGKSDWGALHHAYYLDKTTITADRVQPNTFYLYDVASGVYRTTDGGVNWTKVYDRPISDWSYWHSKIEAVPGSAGELFFTSGPQHSETSSIPGMIPFMHSKDGGASWQVVKGVEAVTFGYGAAKDPGGPATIYVHGSVNGVFGIWYSADSAQTWTQIGERPMGSMDGIRTISGDMDKFGLVYVGFGGSGYAYLDFSGAPTTPAPNPVTPPPSQVGVIVSALDDVGAAATVGNGAVVNDSTPTLSGTLSSALNSGQKLSIFRDGQLIGQVAPASTSWSFTDPGAGNGKHDYVVRVVDSLGQGGSTSAAFSLNIDTVAPTQAVSVTGVASTGGSLDASSLLRTSLATTSATTAVNGTVGGTLAEGESVVVFRDGVRLGNASVSNGNWSFNDGVTSGSFKYTAQIVDAAGNVGQMSNVLSVSLGSTGAGTVNVINGTTRDDVLVGTSGADKISGVPSTGGRIGKGTVDALTGGAGNDVFVLGDSRGRFYDDGSTRSSGSSDYVRITDFSSGDKLQLKGSASEYLQGRIENLHGYSGTGIYHDSNNNGILDHRDELIALVQNHGPIDLGGFIFV
jgi:hypothetical protein